MKTKAIALMAALLVTASSFTGCGLVTAFKEGVREGVREAMEENASEHQENDTPYEEETDHYSEAMPVICTVGNISFEVDGSWEEMSGYEGAYSTADKKTVYMLQGTSVLGSYTPEEFFTQLVEMYTAEEYEVTYSDESVSELTAADGTECHVGRIEMLQNSVKFCIDVLIAPDKNTVLTFASQCAEFTEPDTDIRSVTETAVFHIGTEDMISGRSYTVSSGTEIHLQDDGRFFYYAEAGDPDSDYYTGSYEVYYGQPAMDKLISMTEYGLTEEELERTLSASMNGYTIGGSMPYEYFDDETGSDEDYYHVCRDTFYAVIMNTDTQCISGEESEAEGTALYLGYYIEELDMFDLVSANTFTYTQWTPTE